MPLPQHLKIDCSQTDIFDAATLKTISLTLDFFTNFNEEFVERLYRKLLWGYATWQTKKREHPPEKQFASIQTTLFEVPDEEKMPWDYNDYRASSPIKLLRHLWGEGLFRDDYTYLLLKPLALAIAIRESKKAWKNEILSEALVLQALEKEMYRLGHTAFKESRAKQTRGLRQNDGLANLNSNHERKELEKLIHDRASELLAKEKPKRDIGTMIYKSGIIDLNGKKLSRKTIGRYLASHPSGLWKPKKRK